MHDDHITVSEPLVRRLLTQQFPQWMKLPLQRVVSGGTDHAIYRLSEDMAVRMPLRATAAEQVAKEQRWLPRLAPYLPLPIQCAIAEGIPCEGYPWPWSICQWLDGKNPAAGSLDCPAQVGSDLAKFVSALHALDTAGGPRPGKHNFGRGVPLALRNAPTRAAISESHGSIDVAAVTTAWDTDLNAAAWRGEPVWIHGDLSPGNLLVADRRVVGVIDFGGLGVGDPACDLIVAWNLLSGQARSAFRAGLSIDDATWARGRGWALSVALIQLPCYRNTNPSLAANAEFTINAVLADHRFN